METAILNKFSRIFVGIYLAITAVLVVSEVLSLQNLIAIFKPMLIPALALAYIFDSKNVNRLYLTCLAFAWASNIFFLSSSANFLLLGITAFMVQRLLSILIVLRLIEKLYILACVIATLPFLFIFSLLINITMPVDAPSFYPTIVNAILIAVMAGIALSGYILNDNRQNSWLAISTLFFVVLVILFLIEKYYISNIVFQPMSALLFALAHYCFYMFVVESEKMNPTR